MDVPPTLCEVRYNQREHESPFLFLRDKLPTSLGDYKQAPPAVPWRYPSFIRKDRERLSLNIHGEIEEDVLDRYQQRQRPYSFNGRVSDLVEDLEEEVEKCQDESEPPFQAWTTKVPRLAYGSKRPLVWIPVLEEWMDLASLDDHQFFTFIRQLKLNPRTRHVAEKLERERVQTEIPFSKKRDTGYKPVFSIPKQRPPRPKIQLFIPRPPPKQPQEAEDEGRAWRSKSVPAKAFGTRMPPVSSPSPPPQPPPPPPPPPPPRVESPRKTANPPAPPPPPPPKPAVRKPTKPVKFPRPSPEHKKAPKLKKQYVVLNQAIETLQMGEPLLIPEPEQVEVVTVPPIPSTTLSEPPITYRVRERIVEKREKVVLLKRDKTTSPIPEPSPPPEKSPTPPPPAPSPLPSSETPPLPPLVLVEAPTLPDLPVELPPLPTLGPREELNFRERKMTKMFLPPKKVVKEPDPPAEVVRTRRNIRIPRQLIASRRRARTATDPNSDDAEYQISGDWWSKYCIFQPDQKEEYYELFNAYDVDDSGRHTGRLNSDDVIDIVSRKAPSLHDLEIEYVKRVMNILGCDIDKRGADFPNFSVMTALCQRIAILDDWMRQFIKKMNFKSIEMKLTRSIHLFSHLVEPEATTIPMGVLLSELLAGGIPMNHVKQFREKFSDKPSFDLIDFLTYVPLFICIHSSVVTNPLEDPQVHIGFCDNGCPYCSPHKPDTGMSRMPSQASINTNITS